MRHAIAIALLMLTGCAYGPGTSQVAPGSEVGGVGNIRYDHKLLNANTHMLTVHVSPGMLETEASMSQRLFAYANEFAAKTCARGYNFISDPNPDIRLSDLTQRTKVYTFRCT